MQPPATPATPVPCGNAAFASDMNLAQDQTTHILHDHDGESGAKPKSTETARMPHSIQSVLSSSEPPYDVDALLFSFFAAVFQYS